MAAIFVKLDQPVCAFFRKILQAVLESLREEGSPRGYRPEAEDDQEFWIDGLKSDNLEALEALRDLVFREGFGCESIELEMDVLFAVMRACSCLRLHLRGAALSDISDKDLESPDFHPVRFRDDIHHAYVCYMLLAHVQTAAILAASK